ncbi:MAG: HAMP domain-containing protein [Rhodospirillales bacterium]|nr:HAMP domain-containing protein [Rhodospirillales bacterium]
MNSALSSPSPRRSRLSPITRRILAVNVFALVILVGGLLFLGQYQRSLVQTELFALQLQADTYAAAVAEVAITVDQFASEEMVPELAARIIRRVIETTDARARLYHADGELVADSRALGLAGNRVVIEELPQPGEAPPRLLGRALEIYHRALSRLFGLEPMEAYQESPNPRAEDYAEVVAALGGDGERAVRIAPDGGLILSVAVPVQRYKKVLGALLLSKDSAEIDAAMYEVRLDILKMFGVALAVTVLLSLYLAGTIARPLLLLAAAARRVRGRVHERHGIPDFGRRNDEIGELAASLREMNEALWQRMDAIESFAADVAHEIKNPLTSIRSAVETLRRVDDSGQREKLMAIIADDIQRLDRLISDISAASRVDAELSRAKLEPVRLDQLLRTLVEVHRETRSGGGVALALDIPGDAPLAVRGVEGRLVQVFRNLIANAVSFSPPGGTITLAARAENGMVVATVEDEGPGIPEGSEDAIFGRFYSSRPEGEKFGIHSGLGLSISRQIVVAHGGSIRAENRRDGAGRILGARFVVALPAA